MKITEIEGRLEEFRKQLKDEEKSETTIRQYLKDVSGMASWAKARNADALTKELVMDYKEELTACCTPATVNARLCGLNKFFSFAGCPECKVRLLRLQRDSFASAAREMTYEDYVQLLKTAYRKGDRRLQLIILTIGCTGIRVSELSAITVEALEKEEAVIRLKGKIRRILLPGRLCEILGQYAETRNIKSGPIFITRCGNPVNRTNLWKMMKNVCEEAGVSPEKVFPHNIRHLFARRYYDNTKDIAKLADILGHSSIETTRIYIRSTGEEERRQIEATGMLVD